MVTSLASLLANARCHYLETWTQVGVQLVRWRTGYQRLRGARPCFCWAFSQYVAASLCAVAKCPEHCIAVLHSFVGTANHTVRRLQRQPSQRHVVVLQCQGEQRRRQSGGAAAAAHRPGRPQRQWRPRARGRVRWCGSQFLFQPAKRKISGATTPCMSARRCAHAAPATTSPMPSPLVRLSIFVPASQAQISGATTPSMSARRCDHINHLCLWRGVGLR